MMHKMDRIIEQANYGNIEAIQAYQSYEIDNLVSEMRNLNYDKSDEEIYDEISETCELSEFERIQLAERLGIS